MAEKVVCVEDIALLMEKIAPPILSEEWDNCGLQVGSYRWEVRKIWVALDPLLPVIADAGRQQVDMVITHHPLMLKAIKAIDVDTYHGKIIKTALNNQIAIYSAHTNLDSAAEGINDVLALKIGLEDLKPLVKAKSCMDFETTKGEFEALGLGRIGQLVKPRTVKDLAGDIKRSIGLKSVKAAGNLGRMVNKVAVCSGSGGSLIGDFLKSDADVYVSGDLRYHDARLVEDAGRAFIDIGHFASEHIIIDALVKKLTSAAKEYRWGIQIEPCGIENDPFEVL